MFGATERRNLRTAMLTRAEGLDKGYFDRIYHTERFFSGYARLSSLNFVLSSSRIKSVNFTSSLQLKTHAIQKNCAQTKIKQHSCRSNKSKFYFKNDLQKTTKLVSNL